MLLNLALVDFRILIVVYADHQNIARVAHNDCIDAKGQPNHILIMHVFPSTQVHANQADEVCLRVGDKSKKLNFDQRLQLMYSKGTRFFEDTPHDAPPDTPHDAPHDEATVEEKILAFCSVPRSRDEVLAYLKLSDRKNLRTKYLNPLLASGKLKMTLPDKPRSKQQKYVKA